jgi:hypothetical protein
MSSYVTVLVACIAIYSPLITIIHRSSTPRAAGWGTNPSDSIIIMIFKGKDVRRSIQNYSFALAPLRTVSSFVASIMFPLVFNLPVINAFWPLSLPFARSIRVSSERMIVTSAFG